MADFEINEIATSVTTLADADLFEVEQSSTSKKLTATLLKDYIETAPVFKAGTASAGTHPKQTAGTLLTTPEAGAMEFDGSAFYTSLDTTSGRRQQCDQHIFRLTANGSALGPTIADYFGANSAFPTVTNGVYELTYYLWFTKTTANSVTWTVTNTQTYTNIAAFAQGSGGTGIASWASMAGVGIKGVTTAAAALPASASLSAADHMHVVHVIAECGTAGNIRLRVTSASGTVTPLRGSYYTARRLFAGNVGVFAA